MKKRITLATFRRLDAAEEQMLRAVMPRTSAADPDPLPLRATERSTVVATVGGTRLARRSMAALTYTLAEVSRGN